MRDASKSYFYRPVSLLGSIARIVRSDGRSCDSAASHRASFRYNNECSVRRRAEHVGWSDDENERERESEGEQREERREAKEYILPASWMLHHYVTPRRGHQIKSKRGLEHLEDNKALSTRGRDSIR